MRLVLKRLWRRLAGAAALNALALAIDTDAIQLGTEDLTVG